MIPLNKNTSAPQSRLLLLEGCPLYGQWNNFSHVKKAINTHQSLAYEMVMSTDMFCIVVNRAGLEAQDMEIAVNKALEQAV